METDMVQSESKPQKRKKPAKPKKPVKIEINISWCKSCGLCVEYCNPGTLEMDGIYPKVVAADSCTRCLLCEAMCPDFAIEVKDDETQAGDTENKPS
jgi:2-oxoglutarate ferredoxin oxidoreductase subunit delta